MKWVLFAILLAAIPALNNMFRTRPDRAVYAWFMLGFLPFVLGPAHLMLAPVSWAYWPGYVKGMEYTALDSLAIAILIGPSGGRARMPFKLPIFLYMLAVAIAIPQADTPFAAFFYLWQLARVALVVAAVARVASMERGSDAIIKGLIAGLAFHVVFAFNDRLHGELRSGGLLGDRNLLGFIAHMVVMPAFGLLLAHRWQGWGAVGLASGAAVAVLTGSRAAMGLLPAGLAFTYVLSLMRRWSARKAAAGVGMLLLIAAAAPFAQQTMAARIAMQNAENGTSDTGYDERAAFEKAAGMMMADHPMGIGANMYVIVANVHGYSARAGVVWTTGSRATNVHNSYLLIGAETGYFGLATFVLLLTVPLLTAIGGAWRHRDDPRGEILIALAGSIVAVAAHCSVEWIFVAYPSQYAFAIVLGLIGGIIYQLRHKTAEGVVTPSAPAGRRYMLGPAAGASARTVDAQQ